MEAALAKQAAHAGDRAVRRLIRRTITKLVDKRSAELSPQMCGCDRRRCRHLPALWAGYARRVGSCEYAKVARNHLTGTEVAFPFSCRVPGCPHCESARVAELRRRFLPLIEAGVRPRVAYLTTRNVPVGALGPGWSAISAAFARLWRSPLFAAVEQCRTPRQRAARRHAPGSTCAGHVRRCRAGKVGCLAAVVGDNLRARRECAGRCRRTTTPHPACRACRGHQPATAALLSLETTANRRDQTWHPHANLLYDGGYIPQPALAAAWARALDAERAIVHIRDAAKAPSGHRGDWSLKHALYETVKYAIKPDDKLIDSAAPSWYIEWVEARRCRRLVRSYGDWHGVADVEIDDDATSEPTVELTDDDGRHYRLPVLDPVTDDEADWFMLPGDKPRAPFVYVAPPSTDRAPRRPWLVSHAIFAADSRIEAPP